MRLVLTTLVLAACAAATSCGGRKGPVGPPQDLRQTQLDDSARQAFQAGDYGRAETLYADALQRAYLRDDDEAIADAAYYLAASRARQDKLDEARAGLADARRGVESASPRQQHEVTLLEAKIARRQGETIEAQALIDQALATGPTGDMRARLILLKGEIACDERSPAEAQRLLDQTPRNAATAAAWERLAGRVRMLEANYAAAADAFDREAELHRRDLQYDAMAEALARAGEAYTAAGNYGASADRYLRAGRSAHLQGREANARRWLERAIEAAERADDPNLASDAQRWLHD